MVKVRKMVDIVLDDESSKRITIPIPNEKENAGAGRLCVWLADHLKPELSGDVEQLFILTFKGGGLVGVYLISVGSKTCAIFQSFEILKVALQDKADLIIALHNHPPDIEHVRSSPADISMLSDHTQFYGSIGITFWILICNKEVNLFTFYFSDEKVCKYDIKASPKIIKNENGEKIKLERFKIKKNYEPIVVNSLLIRIVTPEKKKRVAHKEPKEKQPKKKTETKTKRRVTPQKSMKG